MFFLTRIPFIICVIRLILNDVSQFFQLGKRTHGCLFQVGCFLKLWRLILFNPIIVAGRLTEMKHLQIQRYLPLHEELKQYFVIEVQLCGSKAFTQENNVGSDLIFRKRLGSFAKNAFTWLVLRWLAKKHTLSWPCPTIKRVSFTALWVFYDVCSHINNWDVDSLISGISVWRAGTETSLCRNIVSMCKAIAGHYHCVHIKQFPQL